MKNEPFDDGFDWIIKDKATGEQLALFHDQNEVLPFAYKIGRDTVTLEKVKREGKKEMSEQRIVNLSEMMLKVVSEEVLLPKTADPDKEAADLTKDTGLYHYADHDDMIGKPVIINTNVEATNEGEWMEKAYNTPVNEETPVIEPSNFEKNDEYNVSDSDQVAEDEEPAPAKYKAYFNMKSGWYELKNAETGEVVEPRLALDVQDAIKKAAAYNKDGAMTEGYDRDAWEAGYEAFENGHECPEDPSGKDGWMEAKKEHRKAGQMDEAEEAQDDGPDWKEVGIGLYKHNYLPLAYDDNSGQTVLYDIEGAQDLDDAETVGVFDSKDQMCNWIADNIKQDVAEEYRRVAEGGDGSSTTSEITTSSNGVNNDDGDNYGPAPVQGQNDMEFDKDGKFVIEDESHIYQPGPDDKLKMVFYQTNGKDPNDDDLYIGDVVLRSLDDLEQNFPRETYGDYMFAPIANDGRRFDDEEHFTFSYDDVAADLSKFGSGTQGVAEDFEDGMNDDVEGDATDVASDDLGEGKDYRYDPDAEDGDYDRFERYKQRKHGKKARRRDIDEAGGDIERAFMLAVDFKQNGLEILHKGMTDTDSAIALMADGGSKEALVNELTMAGFPMTAEIDKPDHHTLVVLDSTFRGAMDAMNDMDSCHELVEGLDIDPHTFYGFLIQGKTGDTMNHGNELAEDAEEDEMYEAPEFVVSSENLYSTELAQDPMFIQVMNEAFLTIAEKVGQNVEGFNPSLEEVDEVIELGIDNYPNGHKYSFMMTDPMARDAINDAFNILWDEGKINPEAVA